MKMLQCLLNFNFHTKSVKLNKSFNMNFSVEFNSLGRIYLYNLWSILYCDFDDLHEKIEGYSFLFQTKNAIWSSLQY